ncbi:MAG: hypothetical protein Q4F65_12940 [Propionibacteriaceae bacterium]|nr:hypothetical protein [Propionibacteriaceae bacterium]
MSVSTRTVQPSAASGRPTWDELVETMLTAQANGYELGYQDGMRAVADERDAEVIRAKIREVTRNVIADMGVPAARAAADQKSTA